MLAPLRPAPIAKAASGWRTSAIEGKGLCVVCVSVRLCVVTVSAADLQPYFIQLTSSARHGVAIPPVGAVSSLSPKPSITRRALYTVLIEDNGVFSATVRVDCGRYRLVSGYFVGIEAVELVQEITLRRKAAAYSFGASPLSGGGVFVGLAIFPDVEIESRLACGSGSSTSNRRLWRQRVSAHVSSVDDPLRRARWEGVFYRIQIAH